jgi:glyoxylase I family protein
VPNHFGLTVRDADASAAWYEEVLGFQRAGEFEAPDGARRKVFLRHDSLQVRLGLTQHRHGSQDPFDETRAGLDHLAFSVASREELEAWAERLSGAALVGRVPARYRRRHDDHPDPVRWPGPRSARSRQFPEPVP